MGCIVECKVPVIRSTFCQCYLTVGSKLKLQPPWMFATLLFPSFDLHAHSHRGCIYPASVHEDISLVLTGEPAQKHATPHCWDRADCRIYEVRVQSDICQETSRMLSFSVGRLLIFPSTIYPLQPLESTTFSQWSIAYISNISPGVIKFDGPCSSEDEAQNHAYNHVI